MLLPSAFCASLIRMPRVRSGLSDARRREPGQHLAPGHMPMHQRQSCKHRLCLLGLSCHSCSGSVFFFSKMGSVLSR